MIWLTSLESLDRVKGLRQLGPGLLQRQGDAFAEKKPLPRLLAKLIVSLLC